MISTRAFERLDVTDPTLLTMGHRGVLFCGFWVCHSISMG